MEIVLGQLVRDDQPLAIELASTIHVIDGQPVDALVEPADVSNWVRAHRAHLAALGRTGLDVDDFDAPDAASLGRLRRLRDATRDLLMAIASGTEHDADAVGVLNDALRRAPASRELWWPAGEAPESRSTHAGGPVDTLASLVADDAVDVLVGERGRVIACGAPSCVLLFVTSDPRRTWCSPACGNRARVARHYRQARSSSRST